MLSDPTSLAAPSSTLQPLDTSLIDLSTVPRCIERFNRKEDANFNLGEPPTKSVTSPQRPRFSSLSSGTDSATSELLHRLIQCPSGLSPHALSASGTEYSIPFHENIASGSGLLNLQSSSRLSLTQGGLCSQVKNPALPGILQANQQGAVPPASQKIELAKRRRRKNQQISCISCSKAFTRPCDLRYVVHMHELIDRGITESPCRKHARTHERTSKCNIAGCSNTQGFALHKDLRRHFHTVHLKSTFTCHFPSCEETFSRSDNCLRHFEEQHS